jgi:hypothetical protein
MGLPTAVGNPAPVQSVALTTADDTTRGRATPDAGRVGRRVLVRLLSAGRASATDQGSGRTTE